MAKRKIELSDWIPETFEAWFPMCIIIWVNFVMIYQFPPIRFGIGLLPLHVVFVASLMWYCFIFTLSLGEGVKLIDRITYSWRKLLVLTLSYFMIPVFYFYKVLPYASNAFRG